jgi:hypothetical protein
MLSDKTVPRLSIDPFSDGFLAEPYAHHALLRDAGPVFRWNAAVSTVLPGTLIHTVRGVGYMFALPVEPLRRGIPTSSRPTRL